MNPKLSACNVRLTLLLVPLVPAGAFLGACAAYDNGERTPWRGIAAGAGGLFFGLAFGGGLPRRWMDALFGPEEKP